MTDTSGFLCSVCYVTLEHLDDAEGCREVECPMVAIEVESAE